MNRWKFLVSWAPQRLLPACILFSITWAQHNACNTKKKKSKKEKAMSIPPTNLLDSPGYRDSVNLNKNRIKNRLWAPTIYTTYRPLLLKNASCVGSRPKNSRTITAASLVAPGARTCPPTKTIIRSLAKISANDTEITLNTRTLLPEPYKTNCCKISNENNSRVVGSVFTLSRYSLPATLLRTLPLNLDSNISAEKTYIQEDIASIFRPSKPRRSTVASLQIQYNIMDRYKLHVASIAQVVSFWASANTFLSE